MKNINWNEKVMNSAKQWNHEIYKITTVNGKILRRSVIFWSCCNHPAGGSHTFENLSDFTNFLEKKNLISDFSKKEIEEFILQHKGKSFYVSRMDPYLNPTGDGKSGPRKYCCKAGYLEERKDIGYEALLNLLKERGQHYNTLYTLLASKDEYRNKYKKCLIRCETHGETFEYGLMALQGFTSCPCPKCRKDPNTKNRAVPNVRRINGGVGRGTRHRKRVLQKYGNKCFLSASTFELHFHHLDSQDYYTSLANLWEVNGVPVCGIVHRNYHNVFLKKHSLIKKEYGILIETEIKEKKKPNPDSSFEGVEVSRYTFCEFLRFLIYDIQTNGGYVHDLNKKIKHEYEMLKRKKPEQDSTWEPITLDKTISAYNRFCAEYKGENWAMAKNLEIDFANDASLWEKVENSWNV